MSTEALQFIWQNTRVADGDIRLHVERGGKLMIVQITREALAGKYKVENDRLVEAVTNDAEHIERAVKLKARVSPPTIVYEPGTTGVFRHYLLVLRSGDI